MIGVYLITNIKTNKNYVGKSINIERRWKEHLYMLKNDNHDNISLQGDWNKYGEDNFTFKIIEMCAKDSLTKRENHWIDMFQAIEKGYNFNAKKTSNDTWTPQTRKESRIKDLMELCKKHINDGIGLLYFEDVCKYMRLNYKQMVNLLLDINKEHFEKYGMYVHRNWDSYNEYVAFCHWQGLNDNPSIYVIEDI